MAAGARGQGSADAAVVWDASFAPPADRRSVLDRAHRGDIDGALGRVRAIDTGPRKTSRRRLATLLAVMGPGLVVMVADNDAGGISVYAEAGQNYGLTLVWLLLLLAPVLFVNQEMVARLGAVTGAGHARLIFERFGRRWGAFALGDLVLLNFLTVVTEFIGVALALGYFGVSRYVSVPLAALALVAVTVGGSFRRWERVMYALIALNLLVIPLVFLSHAQVGSVAHVSAPGLEGGFDATALLFVIALVGTTVAPWQLFFHQSNVVDKRISARWLGYERADTLLGTLLFVVGAIGILVACAFAFGGTPLHGEFVDAGAVARGLDASVGSSAGAIFALVLLNASVLGAGIVTLATSYAVGDVSGVKHSLHRGWRDARTFHGTFAGVIALAAAVVLVPGLPLGLVTTVVQALAGILLPSASVFLLLLCNDRAVLGPWVNPRWLNAVGTLVVGALLVLSALLTLTTVLPGIAVEKTAIALAGAVVAVLVALAVAGRGRRHHSTDEPFRGTPWERATWTMPPLETIAAPPRSRSRTIGLVALRAYLTLAVLLLIVKAVQLALVG
jgi:Mn2+/Fe2+ NRAMP family transporter